MSGREVLPCASGSGLSSPLVDFAGIGATHIHRELLTESLQLQVLTLCSGALKSQADVVTNITEGGAVLPGGDSAPIDGALGVPTVLDSSLC